MVLVLRPLVSAAVLCAVLLFLPPVWAQTEAVVDPVVEIEIEPTPHGQPLAPSLGGQSVTGTATMLVKVQCPHPSVFTSGVDVEHNIDTSEEWVFAGLSEPGHGVKFDPPDCLAEATVKEYPVTVDFVFGRDAPAFSETSITFKATPTNASEPYTTTWTENVGFGGAFDARVVGDFELVDGQIPIEIEVTNTANGPIDVTVDVSVIPAQGVLDPQSTTLSVPSRATDGNDKARFTLMYTPNIKATDQFTLDLSAASSQDDTYKLRDVILDVQIDNENGAIYGSSQQTGEGAAPMPLTALLVGLLGAAWARRR